MTLPRSTVDRWTDARARDLITAFSPQPVRIVQSRQLQVTHCRQEPAWKGTWRDALLHAGLFACGSSGKHQPEVNLGLQCRKEEVRLARSAQLVRPPSESASRSAGGWVRASSSSLSMKLPSGTETMPSAHSDACTTEVSEGRLTPE